MILNAQQTPQDSLQEYTGKYKFPDGSIIAEVTVTLDSGILHGYSDMGSSELKKITKDTFEVVAYGGFATFKRDSTGKIISVHIIVGDTNIEGQKTDSLSLSKTYNWFDRKLFIDEVKGNLIYFLSKNRVLAFYSIYGNSLIKKISSLKSGVSYCRFNLL